MPDYRDIAIVQPASVLIPGSTVPALMDYTENTFRTTAFIMGWLEVEFDEFTQPTDVTHVVTGRSQIAQWIRNISASPPETIFQTQSWFWLPYRFTVAGTSATANIRSVVEALGNRVQIRAEFLGDLDPVPRDWGPARVTPAYPHTDESPNRVGTILEMAGTFINEESGGRNYALVNATLYPPSLADGTSARRFSEASVALYNAVSAPDPLATQDIAPTEDAIEHRRIWCAVDAGTSDFAGVSITPQGDINAAPEGILTLRCQNDPAFQFSGTRIVYPGDPGQRSDSYAISSVARSDSGSNEVVLSLTRQLP